MRSSASGSAPTRRSGRPARAAGTRTVDQSPAAAQTGDQVIAGAARYGSVWHSSALQVATRLAAPTVDNYGTAHPALAAVPIRADFDTIDNPFAWSAHPGRDRMGRHPAAGLHFIVFTPSSDTFHRGRNAMDGHFPDGTVLPLDPNSPHVGFNEVLTATHRQNFLVPPRRHRSFPLAELL